MFYIVLKEQIHPSRGVLLQCHFIEITLWHGCSPVNLLHIFRTPFPKNTSGGQLLKETTADLQELWLQKSFFSCVYAMGATCLDIFFYSI